MCILYQVDFYDTANKQVALLCNHQKTVPKSFEITKKKITAKLDMFRDYIKELKQHAKKKDIREYDEEIVLEEATAKQKSNVFVKKFPGNKEKTEALIGKMEERLAKE